MEAVDYVSLGKRIRRLRQSSHLTQAKLAEQIEVSNQFISNLERAKTKGSLDTIVRIANTLGVSVDELLCDSVNKSKDYQMNEITLEMCDCSNMEAKVILNVVKTMKDGFRKLEYAEK